MKNGHLSKKKQKQCDPENPADDDCGDQWDHIAIAAESRLVVSMVPGKRTVENTSKLIEDFVERTDGKSPALITSDEYPPYTTVLKQVYGEEKAQQSTGKPGRPPKPQIIPSPDLVYATVHKEREKGRVVKVHQTLVFGTEEQLSAALSSSNVSSTINTSIVERYNGTDRCFNSRKVRSTYEFSKDLEVHEAASWFGITVYNFCRPNRSLAVKKGDCKCCERTPAMAAGLAPQIYSISEIVGVQLFDDSRRE